MLLAVILRACLVSLALYQVVGAYAATEGRWLPGTAHVYGSGRSVNAGVFLQTSPRCSVGYEWRGWPGTWSGCESR